MPTSQRFGAEAPEDILAEAIDPPAHGPENDATSLTRRSRARSSAARPSKAVRPASSRAVVKRPAKGTGRVAKRPAKKTGRVAKPVRSLVILTMVGGLVATVAIPAFAAAGPLDGSKTLQQVAADNAQTLIVASDASASELTRESYSATTQAEIDAKKAREAAAAAAAARARMNSTASFSGDYVMVSPGSGLVRWPLLNFTKGRGLWDSGYHQGQDLLAPAGTPIYAAAAGVVKVSQESFGGYGVCITIDHVLNGQQVSTLYGHMTYGSRMVASGQTVVAGQMIGRVGSTGSSTANHLHFEVHINGSVVDPWAWLVANAG
jgi:murein DD-endopeptidase MepM/ murein hydrolase activator NlpD